MLAIGWVVWPTFAAPEAPVVVDLANLGWSSVAWSQPTVMLPPVQKTAVSVAAPGQEVAYTLALTNNNQVTQTVTLSDTLPPQLTLVAVDDELSYDAARHTLIWQGVLPPGKLDYSLSLPVHGLPYLDLADYGLPNLCDAFVAAGESCDDQSVTFNLGAAGYSVTLYDRPAYQVVVAVDGFIALETLAPGTPHWLPFAAAPGLRLAGLWQDVDMTASGRWHAAVLSGYIAGHDVFYAQWQNAPHAANPDLTSRFAIALVLDGEGPLAGSLFYLYDHISQPDALVAAGYTIGLQDENGQRGFTYAYARPETPPRGAPPTPGTTLYWQPYGAGTVRRFEYRALVTGSVGETAVNTAHTAWSVDAPAWDTHYLSIRHLTYLPLVISGESH